MQIWYLNRNSYRTQNLIMIPILVHTYSIPILVRTYPIVSMILIQETFVFKYFRHVIITNANMAPDINRVIVDVAINLNKAKISKKHIIMPVVHNVTLFLLRIGASITACIIVLLIPFTIRSVDVDLTVMPNFL